MHPVLRYFLLSLGIAAILVALTVWGQFCLVAFLLLGGPSQPAAWSAWAAFLVPVAIGVSIQWRKARRPALLGAGLSALLAAGLLGWPSVSLRLWPEIRADDPGYWNYAPFDEDGRIARLDAPSTLALPRESLFRIDGATALYPLYSAFVAASWPRLSSQETRERVQVNKTRGAWPRLMAGETDMIFVAGPSRAQRAEAERLGLSLHLTPIGREAFVFYVPDRNPVRGLTQDQIRGIYAGAITRWDMVGGEDRPILAFQRPEGSGSQTMLQKIMGDTPLTAPPQEEIVDPMSGIVERTADYRNYPGAIGYSFRVFVAEILSRGDVRLLAVDGGEPTVETIRSGAYPFAAEFYAVTLGPPEGAAKEFIDWIRGPQGRALIEKTGYVPLAEGE